MRVGSLCLALGLWLVTLGCAAGPSERPGFRELLREAADECARGFSGVVITDINRYGTVEFGWYSPEQKDQFLACFQERGQVRLREALSPGRLAASAGGATKNSIPVEVAGNLLLVPARLNVYEHVTLLLDTGASRTILKRSVLEGLGVAVPTRAASLWPLTLADGRVVFAPFVRVQSLHVGDLTVEDLDVGAYDLLPEVGRVHGVLGGDFLGHFRATIDPEARRLELEVRK